ncbi:MAG: amidohydrolase, partial [Gaiellaceae bacterium]
MNPAAVSLLITRARVWTDGACLPGISALALSGNRILALGSADELEGSCGSAVPRLDAHGATVTPGLWDAHIHLLPW